MGLAGSRSVTETYDTMGYSAIFESKLSNLQQE
jgi:hypothetical protein